MFLLTRRASEMIGFNLTNDRKHTRRTKDGDTRTKMIKKEDLIRTKRIVVEIRYQTFRIEKEFLVEFMS